MLANEVKEEDFSGGPLLEEFQGLSGRFMLCFHCGGSGYSLENILDFLMNLYFTNSSTNNAESKKC